MRKMVSNNQKRVASIREVRQAIRKLRGRMRHLWNTKNYMVGKGYGLCIDKDGVYPWIGSEQEEWATVEAGKSVVILIKPYTGADIRWFLRQPLDKLVNEAVAKLEDLNYTIIDEEVVP